MLRTTDWYSLMVNLISRSVFPILLFHEMSHLFKVHSLKKLFKLEKGILIMFGLMQIKPLLVDQLFFISRNVLMTRNLTENNFFIF